MTKRITIGTRGSELALTQSNLIAARLRDAHPELDVEGPSLRKGVDGEDGYSGFSVRNPETDEERSTGLEELLSAHGVTRVVVVGLALDYCVKATALDAVGAGFATTVLLAATRAVNLDIGDGERAISELEAAGVDVG